MTALYSLLLELVTWFVPGVRKRARIAPSVPGDRRRLLIHAVSAGEMNAASALVREMTSRGWLVTLSAGNDDAWQLAQRIENVERVLRFPWDRRRAVAGWLDAIAPDAVVVIETELWPNFFAACAARKLPLVIANGRIAARPAARYRLARRFFARVLDCVSLIVAVGAAEAGRFVSIGARRERVVAGGNLKADVAPPSIDAASRSAGTILAASTHEGEEALIVDALRGLDGIRLVIAPRHVRRAASVRRLAPEAVLIDTMGSLGQLYAEAAIVIVGGTFVPVGGHDLLEPARHGCAIVTGPHLDNVLETAEAMRAAGALRVTRDLRATVQELLADTATAERLGAGARAYAESQRGAAAFAADRIEELLLTSRSPSSSSAARS
jgi:3-deoxy-D-manno-octulosonic-acid transferase